MEYKPDMEAKKKISPTFRLTILTILVFVGVSVIGVGFLLVSDRVNRRLSDIENTLASLRRERNHIPNISDASSFQLSHRKKRSVSSNASPSQSDFEKRLQALEKRMNETNQAAEILLTQTKDWWFLSLLRGRNGKDGRDGPVGPPGSPGQPGKADKRILKKKAFQGAMKHDRAVLNTREQLDHLEGARVFCGELQ